MRTEQSVEDYLEAVHVLALGGGPVHRSEVARRLGVSQPAVTKAVKKMQEAGYIRTEGMHICLTGEGEKRASEIYGKHVDIRAFLIKLGVNADDAERDACMIEHVICDATYAAIRAFIGDEKKRPEKNSENIS